MALWGTIVNVIAIVAGCLIGALLPRISEGIRKTVMQGLGLAIVVLGFSMTLETNNILITIVSLVVGGILGEWLKIEYRLERVGQKLEHAVHRVEHVIRRASKKTDKPSGTSRISEGFVTATLIYCVGAMAILGSIDSGLRHNHDILYIKSMLDGFASIIFTSTLGIGVIFSAIPLFLYQGFIALTATFIPMLVSDSQLTSIIAEVTAVGGILIIGIGLNILEIKKIHVANLLPSVIIAAVAVPIIDYVSEILL